MIDISKLTENLYGQIKSNASIISDGVKVSVGEYVNMNENNAPWVGIYKGNVDYEPRSMGKHAASWGGTLTVKVVIQEYHGKSGFECEKRLGKLVNNIMNAVWADPTIGGVVDMLTDISEEYIYNENDSKSVHFQWAILSLTFENRTG